MTDDKRINLGNHILKWVAAVSLTVFVGAVIGCGGGGSSSSGSLTTGTTTTGTSTSSSSTTTSSTTTTGSTPGNLPSNVIFYGDGGSDAVPTSNFDLRYVSPDGTGNALYATVPSTVSALTPNASVPSQTVFAAVDPSGATSNYGIYANTSLSTTGAKVIVPPTYFAVDDIAITPNGLTIVFSAQDSNGNSTIYTVASIGGTVTTLTVGDEPSLDPTGVTVVYDAVDTADATQNYIYTIPVAGGTPTQLTAASTTSSDTYYDVTPQFSKQGDRIAFSRTTDSSVNFYANIYTIKPAGTGLTQVTSDTTLFQSGPSFGPDGTMVSYVSVPFAQSTSTDSENGIYTAPSTGAVSGVYTTPFEVVNVVSPVSGTLSPSTYWTGASGRGSASVRYLMMRLHKKGSKKPSSK